MFLHVVFLQGSKVQVKVDYWISFLYIYIYKYNMIIIFDLLVLELLYEDAHDIYQIINRLLYVKVYHLFRFHFSVLTFHPAVKGHIGHVVKPIIRLEKNL